MTDECPRPPPPFLICAFLPQEVLQGQPLQVSPGGAPPRAQGVTGKPTGWNISFVTQILSLECQVTTYPTLLGLFQGTLLNSEIWQRREPHTPPS